MPSDEAYKPSAPGSSLPPRRRCATASSDMPTWPARVLVIVVAVAGCGGSGEPAAPPPYTVTIDVSPLVRQLGGDDADDAAERLAHLGEPVLAALEAALRAEPK